MNASLESLRSNWWSNLLDFGQDVLIPKRKSLGLTQDDVSRMSGLGQSEISRIEGGFARPKDVSCFNSLCSVYRLTEDEKRIYAKLVLGTDLSQEKIESEFLCSFLRGQTEIIYELNRSGNPNLAVKQAKLANYIVGPFIKSVNCKDEILIEEARLRFLLEESVAFWDSSNMENIDKVIDDILKRSNLIYSTSNEVGSKPWAYYQSLICSLEYISGNHQVAKKMLGQLIQSSVLKFDQWDIETTRLAAVCAGKTKDINLLSEVEKKSYEYLINGQTSSLNKALLMEGLARGYINYDIEMSLRILGKAKGFLKESKQENSLLIVRQLQYNLTMLELMLLKDKTNSQIQGVANESLKIASEHGLLRYGSDIAKLMISYK